MNATEGRVYLYLQPKVMVHWQQECEMAGHTEFTLRKQRDAGIQLAFFLLNVSLGLQPMEWQIWDGAGSSPCN